MVQPSRKAIEAVKKFQFIDSIELFAGQGNSTTMQLFMPQINSREFDVLSIQETLMEVLIDFSLTRITIEKYEKNRQWARLSKEARQKFRDYSTNKGELGELFLYTFLEGSLGAPQILSKMSLKTTSGDYTKKSDGIHYLKVPNTDRYHLIFGEAKMYQDIISGFRDAFESISTHKSGKEFEKSLISSQIESEFSDSEDRELINAILYPHEADSVIKVSDAFGIFIGFEIDDADGKTKTEDEYDEWVKMIIADTVKSKISTIEKQITSKGLVANNFYVYLMPFVDLDNTRLAITKGITE
ncbi:HamA C-terminal domain-containing protein [Streptococcus uberis]